MLTTILVIAACVYAVSLRADRIHAGRVTEPRVNPQDGPDSQEKPGSRPVGHSLTTPASSPALGSVTLYRGHSAAFWAWKYRQRTKQYQHARHAARARWQPTVDYALTLAAAVTGVSYWQLRSVSACESNHDPYATNGRFKGIFQLGWRPFGLDPYEPIANALSAAMTVRHDGGWSQWACSP